MWRRHRYLWAAAPPPVAAASPNVAAAPVFVGGGTTPRLAFYNIKRKEVRGGRMSQAAKLSIVGRRLSQMGLRSNNTLRGRSRIL